MVNKDAKSRLKNSVNDNNNKSTIKKVALLQKFIPTNTYLPSIFPDINLKPVYDKSNLMRYDAIVIRKHSKQS